MSTVTYTSAAGNVVEIEARVGDSVMETAVRNGVVGIVGECGGSLSCATCHVFEDEETAALFDPRSELEEDMLDGTAVPRKDNSRLSCQLKIRESVRLFVATPETQL